MDEQTGRRQESPPREGVPPGPPRPDEASPGAPRRLWLRLAGGGRGGAGAGEVRGERALLTRIQALETRLAHLEAGHEGLQDAVYRQAIQHDENLAELRRRLDPRQLARDLSDDERKRGL